MPRGARRALAFDPPCGGPITLQREVHDGGLYLFVGVKQVNEVAVYQDPTPPLPLPLEGVNWRHSLRGWVLALKSCLPLGIDTHAAKYGGDRVWKRGGNGV
jgi:hypothetical protein